MEQRQIRMAVVAATLTFGTAVSAFASLGGFGLLFGDGAPAEGADVVAVTAAASDPAATDGATTTTVAAVDTVPLQQLTVPGAQGPAQPGGTTASVLPGSPTTATPATPTTAGTPGTAAPATTSPPVTTRPATTTTAAPTGTTLPPDARIPSDWPPNKPIPPIPPNCKKPVLEDNGVWNCDH